MLNDVSCPLIKLSFDFVPVGNRADCRPAADDDMQR